MDSQKLVETEQESTAVAVIDNNPAQLIQMAIQQNVDVDKLSKLMELQERYNAGLAKKGFYEALAKFQSEIPTILKQKQGHNYEYAPLCDIIEAIKPHMVANGLSYRFEQNHVDAISVTCVVTHISGHSEQTTMNAAADTSGSKNAVQSIASTVTYLSRYTLTGALGIATADKDMDGRQPGEATAKEKDQFKSHMDAVKDNLESLVAIKHAILDNNLGTAYEAFTEIGEDDRRALWRAPTKGSIWTTEERAIMKSDDWSQARKDFHGIVD